MYSLLVMKHYHIYIFYPYSCDIVMMVVMMVVMMMMIIKTIMMIMSHQLYVYAYHIYLCKSLSSCHTSHRLYATCACMYAHMMIVYAHKMMHNS